MKNAFLASALVLSGTLLPACETSDATQAVFDNEYPVSDAGASASVTLYRGWWSVAQLSEPVLAGAESDPLRVVQGSDYAYALLAPGWDPESGSPPATLLPVRTSAKLSVARGDTLRITISDATAVGNCAAGLPLSQADADFITQRIFPGEFAGQSYDAASCTASPISAGGAGGQAGAEDSGRAGAAAESGAGGRVGAP
jgi:hypothetical protein